MADEVRLVDLEVIKRYSLAVRQESAPAAELLAALDASRAAVLAVLPAGATKARTRPPSPETGPDDAALDDVFGALPEPEPEVEPEPVAATARPARRSRTRRREP